ncbi:alpha/beta hydrolase [Kangiella koreensis]|uniref:Carboxylesterase n=1 Tax=Kangiella koreensis (strain DSM 16069 / JCM 12317 / KCTC 12182 / SW-125) TaxID=523791 RepID=C7R6S7_KANKD|nr:alpha/beta fold hydrolase [Kangiella koreensis]ACV25593.1 Carboxylesterase [Kangiella koreensis DSM 16069]
MSELLPCVTVEPAAEHKATIIWLHGLGADGHDFEPIVPELKVPAELGVKFIFPHAPVIPVTINGGYQMRAWYDIRNADLSQREDEAGVRQSAEQVEQLILHEIEQGIPADKIILAGFSQGGAIALHLATRLDKKLAGIVALSTYLTVPDKLADEKSDTNLNTPIFMAHGQQDPVVPIQRGQYSAKVLEENGFKVQWSDYPMPHAVCLEEIQALGKYIQGVLG